MAYGISLFLNRASSSHTAVDKNVAQPTLVQFSTGCGPHSLHYDRSKMGLLNAGPYSNCLEYFFIRQIVSITKQAKLEEIIRMTCMMIKHYVSPCIGGATFDLERKTSGQPAAFLCRAQLQY